MEVFCSIASAIANMENAKKAGKIMGTTVVTFLVTAAIAANGFAEHTDTISLHADISFLGTAKGKTLIAKASCIRQGRTIALHEVEITDELGTLVARASVNGFVLQRAEK